MPNSLHFTADQRKWLEILHWHLTHRKTELLHRPRGSQRPNWETVDRYNSATEAEAARDSLRRRKYHGHEFRISDLIGMM